MGRVLLFLVTLCLPPAAVAQAPKQEFRIIAFKPNRGLPDYGAQSPFRGADAARRDELKERIAGSHAAEKDCTVGAVAVPNMERVPLSSNLCDNAEFGRLRDLVAGLAPDLKKENLTFWKVNLGPGRPGLLLGHIDISKDDPFHYPYLSLWFIPADDPGSAAYGGSYLAGQLLAMVAFGPDAGQTQVFVKHQSCIECEPWIYLTVVDFSLPAAANPFQFTYNDDHRHFDTTIEYELPGMGHSVDAKVESRIPAAHDANGPHLLQHYKFKDATKDEWWVFVCRELKCDYQLFERELPDRYRKSWQTARKL
jgi:hypothetical protein